MASPTKIHDSRLPRTAGVYLICFDRPYWHARHYLGYASNIQKRIAEHRTGKGARLLDWVNRAGIGWHVVRVWRKATRKDEARLKKMHESPRLCPICRRERNRRQEEAWLWKKRKLKQFEPPRKPPARPWCLEIVKLVPFERDHEAMVPVTHRRLTFAGEAAARRYLNDAAERYAVIKAVIWHRDCVGVEIRIDFRGDEPVEETYILQGDEK